MPRRALPRSLVDPDLTGLAGVLADASRLAMLDAMLDAQPHAIGELARRAGVSAATASSHVRRLLGARLVTVTSAGRNRHVKLASADVAEMLERLAVVASAATAKPLPRAAVLRFARTCYDHLAGVLGVTVGAALVEKGWLHRTSDNFEPAPPLFDWLAAHGEPVLIAGRRPLTRACLDWSERLPHVAGRIGAAIANVFVAERWVMRVRRTRALHLTERGRQALARDFGVRFPEARLGLRPRSAARSK